MTYFEAYRPVLNALKMLPPDDRFPLGSTLFKLKHEMRPPNYLTPTTTYDFTPLLVDTDADAETNLIVNSTFSARSKQYQISYKQSTTVEQRYKEVRLLNQNEWPTSEQLHLNPKQSEALMLALTNRVALIQGRECSCSCLSLETEFSLTFSTGHG